MANLHGFNQEEDYGSFGNEPIPAGNYIGAIVASEEKETRNGNGSYLKLEFEILDGPHKGRRLYTNLNLNNPNETAVRIARAELKLICEACGAVKPSDSVDLHNIPMLLKVELRKRNDTGEPQNVVRGYKPATAGATAPAAAAATAPWKRG